MMRRVNPSDVGVEQDNYYIHLARYMFCARQLKRTDEVLEIGCGTGYGARLLADYASAVYATDLDAGLLESWNTMTKDNLHFFQGSLPNRTFDCVVSYEVIEHIDTKEVPSYLETIKKSLNKNGAAYLSTPRAIPWEQRSKNRQTEHIKEYSPSEFRQILEEHFSRVFIFAQNDAIISSQNPEMAWNLVAIALA